jgi:hypothetical protein
MRPVQQLYYANGQLHCPIHGNKYIRLMSSDAASPRSMSRIDWCCTAILPDGSHCLHSATWESIADIQDPDVEQLVAAHQHRDFRS